MSLNNKTNLPSAICMVPSAISPATGSIRVQDPNGPYAAVIPKWIAAMIQNEPICINGDGQTSRDFCYVANVVQANLLAATVENQQAVNEVYNVALSARTTLNQLSGLLRDSLLPWY